MKITISKALVHKAAQDRLLNSRYEHNSVMARYESRLDEEAECPWYKRPWYTMTSLERMKFLMEITWLEDDIEWCKATIKMCQNHEEDTLSLTREDFNKLYSYLPNEETI